MREHFDLELQSLETQFLDMGQAVLENGSKALLSMLEDNHNLAQVVLDADQTINNYQTKIEVSCANLLALQQPLVSDLRLVIVIMTSCSDLERMGDHFVGIAKSILKLKDEERLPEFEKQLQDMGQKALEMLHQLMTIFPAHKSEPARQLAAKDAAIDDIYWVLSKDMMSQMKHQEVHIRNGTEYLFILNHIERFSDYVASICERLVYLETGYSVELN